MIFQQSYPPRPFRPTAVSKFPSRSSQSQPPFTRKEVQNKVNPASVTRKAVGGLMLSFESFG